MKEDKRIGVQGEGSKTPEITTGIVTAPDQTGDYLSGDELRVLIAGKDNSITTLSEALDAAHARMSDLEDALREANDQIEMRREAHRRAALDYFDLVAKLPQDSNGAYIGLDDIVEWQGERYQVVAISHKGKVVIRRESATDGKGGKWLDDARLVTFAGGAPQDHEAIVSKLRAAGFVPVSEAVGKCPSCEHEAENRPESAPDSTLWEDSEFWRQQYGNSQMEVMRLTTQYSDACYAIDDLEKRLEGAELAAEALENARALAVALENEAARLKSEVQDLGASLHAAERKADRAVMAWDHVMCRTEGVMQLLASIAGPMEYPARNAIAVLVNNLKDGIDESRKIMGARYASDFAHKGADHDEA